MDKSTFLPKLLFRCETCHGAGVLPGRCREDELLPCPTCKGKGVLVQKKSKKNVQEQPCDNPNCHNGRVQQVTVVNGREVVTDKVCPVCEGYGVIYNEVVTIETLHEKCPTCEGRAVIRADEMRRKKLESFCPDCHGTGYILAEKPAKKALHFGIGALVYPALMIVRSAFSIMLKGTKAALSSRKANAKSE